MHSLTIRYAVKEDLPEILQLYQQPALDNGNALSLPAASQLFEKMQRYPQYWLFVAVLGDLIVGTFTLLVMDNILHGTPSAIVEAVAVDPTYQSQGIGSYMMRWVMTEATKAGCYKLVLSSNAKRNRAHKFYENLGFTRHGYSFYVDLVPTAPPGAAAESP
jgi:ribosomal protein S18 acetylase RimI-like enzyme